MLHSLLELRLFHDLPCAAFVPRTTGILLAEVALAGGVVEVFVNEAGSGRNLTDGEGVLSQALEREGESLHVSDLTGHEELQSIDGAGIITKVDEPLINNFGPGFGGYVAAKIDIQLAGDLEIVSGPRIASGIVEVDATAASDRDQRIDFGSSSVLLCRFEVHAGESANNFEMAEFFGADIHQQVFASHILAIQTLDGVLHRGGEFPVRAAKLLQEHLSETGVRSADIHGVHQFFYVVIHKSLMQVVVGVRRPECNGRLAEHSGGRAVLRCFSSRWSCAQNDPSALAQRLQIEAGRERLH